jgi:hypothetical protein
MKITKRHIYAAIFAIAAVAATATVSLASTNATVPPKRDQVMTDPCAQVMNWPHRALVALRATPSSERGLQCPIEEDVGPASDE